jgi:hypothetical protein
MTAIGIDLASYADLASQFGLPVGSIGPRGDDAWAPRRITTICSALL